MQLKRLFSADGARGSRNYLKTQRKYELVRTVLYFAVSLSLFVAGLVQTGERINLLSVVAVLGCLPASKSAVSAIMFFRFKGCSSQSAETIEQYSEGLSCLYDMVFTSEKKNFCVSHLAVCGNTVCGFTESEGFDENEFYKHIGDILKLDGHRDVTVKIFNSLGKYTQRLEQLKALDADTSNSQAVIGTLKSVAL